MFVRFLGSKRYRTHIEEISKKYRRKSVEEVLNRWGKGILGWHLWSIGDAKYYHSYYLKESLDNL